ncbi:TetR family transcriptional regulator [Bombiscardovia nodaiensis]|uniref:TetR family transcriptional regulator n=1 Tax=Bombiscardovia nodaiensis TaxID=2932181 RepID=A0ABM8B8C1_9BIFI|nr:TetR family transcriptional regulator [Bombiscardovia nodaiensis]
MPKIQEATLNEHRQRLLKQILDATESILKQEGRTGLTMSAVSERTGIARNSLYRYAQNADQLCNMVLERRLPTWSQALERAIRGASSPQALIEAWSKANLRQASEHGHAWMMDLFSATSNEQVRASFVYGEYTDDSLGQQAASGDGQLSSEDAMVRFHHQVNGPLISAWQQLAPSHPEIGVELTRGLVQSGMRLIDALERQTGRPPQVSRREAEGIIEDVLSSVREVTATLSKRESDGSEGRT